MKYMGSKNRIAKHILPIMLQAANERGITKWVEPFVGGGNMIDKVPAEFERVGYDLNEHVIMAMIDIRDNTHLLPDCLSYNEYKSLIGKPPGSITSLYRFGASFGGKFEGGFARGKNNKGSPRDYWCETLRNAQKQSPKIKSVEFIHADYSTLSFSDSLIYCDPPYQGTSGYKTGAFDHEDFSNGAAIRLKITLSLYPSMTRRLMRYGEGRLRQTFQAQCRRQRITLLRSFTDVRQRSDERA